MRYVRLGSLLVALALPTSALTMITGVSVASSAAPGVCNGSWAIEPSPNVSDGGNSLRAVAAISPSDVWAVGLKIPRSGTKPLIEHWDGASWTVVLAPYAGDAQLNGVAAVSTSDVWAVGYRQSLPITPLTYHWDGTAWSIVSTPTPGTESYLMGVAAVSANDVWAIGAVYRAGRERPLTMHWDGTAWAVVPAPWISTGNTEMMSLAAIGTGDVWAVGYNYDDQYNFTPVALHWGGVVWQKTSLPHLDQEYLYSVAGVTSNDVWAVGEYGAPSSKTLTLHWNGVAWSLVPSPSPGESSHTLWSVDVAPSGRAWAVGSYMVGIELYPLILGWDGVAWNVEPSPVPNPASYNRLFGVSADSASDSWAVGEFVDPARSGYSTLTEHRCG
jgi:hypothetical protein